MRASTFRFVSIFLLASSSLAHAAGYKALVYKGAGACDDGCYDAAASVAKLAGFAPQFVGPTETDPSIFEGAAVWIQPGGHSQEAAKAMKKKLKENLRKFVADGGGYVGFCAGGFIATEKIADTGKNGFGIFPGTTDLYPEKNDAAMLTLTWEGKQRQIYWEGGPFFFPFPGQKYDSSTEVIAQYPDGTIATMRSVFGKGRVFVTGVHPESPRDWKEFYHLQDADGDDFDLATEMIGWAAQ